MVNGNMHPGANRTAFLAATEIHHSQPLLVFDNHDRMRSWDRFGDGVHDAAIARIIAALLLTSRAAVLLYQGEEIGQRSVTPPRIEEVRDPLGVRGWPKDKGRDGDAPVTLPPYAAWVAAARAHRARRHRPRRSDGGHHPAV